MRKTLWVFLAGLLALSGCESIRKSPTAPAAPLPTPMPSPAGMPGSSDPRIL